MPSIVLNCLEADFNILARRPTIITRAADAVTNAFAIAGPSLDPSLVIKTVRPVWLLRARCLTFTKVVIFDKLKVSNVQLYCFLLDSI